MAERKTVIVKNVDAGESTKHGTNYLDVAMGDPAELVYSAMKKLKDVEFDTFVGRGLSGALVAPLLARSMSKFFAISRKKEISHSSALIEGRLGSKWIFVDDLIASGSTLGHVLAAVTQVKPHCEFVGIYMYGAEKEKSDRVEFFRSALTSVRTYKTCIDQSKAELARHLEENPWLA